MFPSTELPNGRKPIGNKWVQRYRARLVCLGYTQIPGIDFQDNFAPVVNDMTFQTVLTLAALYDWDLAILDVETTFLYGDLKEDIYMDLPGFLSLEKNISKVTNILENKFKMKQANRKMCLKLNHALYGLVQAARSWWLKFVNALVNVGFERGEVDPCLIFRKNE